MKKFVVTMLFSLIVLSAFCQNPKTRYDIVGKGSSGQYKCSGYVIEDTFFKTIEVYISDMLNRKFSINKKVQVNESTIKYICGNTLEDMEAYGIQTEYTVIKQKCPNGKDVYFFEFPPLYDGQGRTVYKVKRSYSPVL